MGINRPLIRNIAAGMLLVGSLLGIYSYVAPRQVVVEGDQGVEVASPLSEDTAAISVFLITTAGALATIAAIPGSQDGNESGVPSSYNESVNLSVMVPLQEGDKQIQISFQADKCSNEPLIEAFKTIQTFAPTNAEDTPDTPLAIESGAGDPMDMPAQRDAVEEQTRPEDTLHAPLAIEGGADGPMNMQTQRDTVEELARPEDQQSSA